jgi:hypothetical protein
MASESKEAGANCEGGKANSTEGGGADCDAATLGEGTKADEAEEGKAKD